MEVKVKALLLGRWCLASAIVVPVLIIDCAGCHQSQVPESHSLPEVAEDSSNCAISVVNESSSRSPIDITVRIDDLSAVEGSFAKVLHASAKSFQFLLPEGRHVMNVSTKVGGAAAEREFEVHDKVFVLVQYFYSPGGKVGVAVEPTLDIQVQDCPFTIK